MSGSPIELIKYPNGLESIRVMHVFPPQCHGNHIYQVKKTEEILLFAIQAWNIGIVQQIDSNNVTYFQFNSTQSELMQMALIFDTCYCKSCIVSAVHLEITFTKSESSTQTVPKYSHTEATLLCYGDIGVMRREETVTQLTN